MNRKIKIMADSTCDLSSEMKDKFEVETVPLHIVYDGESFDDGVNIQPSDVIRRYKQSKQLPKTAAVSTYEYIERFKKYVDDGYEIIHVNIGSSISSSHQNCVAAAAELGHVYPVDSQNLSVGTGLLACKAHDLSENTEMTAEEIAEELRKTVSKVHTSFVIDNLEFLRAGGRCSTLTMLGANLLKIKPCIEVNNADGASMTVGKKYRGKFEKVITDYTRDKLAQYTNIDKQRVGIVSADVPSEIVDSVYKIIEDFGMFKEIYVTAASCTITSHCGSGTLGVIFMTE